MSIITILYNTSKSGISLETQTPWAETRPTAGRQSCASRTNWQSVSVAVK